MYIELVKMRNALEILAQDQNLGLLARFPEGCCGCSSYLIATYLEEKGWGKFDYIEGRKKRSINSHAWLLSETGYVIDLTADQFGFNKIIYTLEIEYPLLELFPKQSNKGNASILSGTKVNNSYHLAYQKILDYVDGY